tara:strand:- start:33991 stop:34830 length:840 start_codon:yes stop_codon:yes gene_type:complete
MKTFISIILLSFFSFSGHAQNCPENINNSPGNSPDELVADVYDGEGNIVQSINCAATGNSGQIDCDLESYNFPSNHFILIELTNGSNSTTCAYDSNGELLSANPLPVELIDLTGDNYKEGHVIKWSTASETDCSHYRILSSFDGYTWSEVGELPGAGNSNELSNYKFVNKPDRIGLIYYKVVQYDYDGDSSTLGIISLRNDQSRIAVENKKIVLNSIEIIRNVKIVSATGRTIDLLNNINKDHLEFEPTTDSNTQLLFVIVELENGQVIKDKIFYSSLN